MTADDWTPAVWSYAAVMDMQARLDPARMTGYADDWHRAIDRIAEVLVELNQQVGAQLDRSWRGHGADASVESLRRYVEGSLAGLAACRSVAVQLSELSTAAGNLRAASGGFAADALDDALAEVRQRYSGPAVTAGNAVDEFPAPPDPFNGPGRRSASTLPVAASQPEQPPFAAPPPSAAPFGSTPSPGAPSTTQPTAFVRAADPIPPWHTPTHTTALPDSMPLRPDSPATAPGTPAAAVVPSTPPQSPTVTPRTTTPPVAPYLPGMYPGHMGRDSGGEHRVPSYLVSAGNTSELIGELPLVAPPVIGE